MPQQRGFSMSWLTGETEINSVRLIVDGVEITTGTANIYYYLDSGSGTQWLDTDEVSLTSTRTGISMTYDSEVGFKHVLEVPVVFDAENITWEVEHSVYGIISSETNFVGGPETLTGASIANSVWERQTNLHTTSGSFGKFFQDWESQDLAAHSATLTSILDETNAIDSALSAIQGTGFDTSTDSLTSIRDEQISHFTDIEATIDSNFIAISTDHDVTQSLISNLNDPSAGDVADAVWNELRSAHTNSGSFGEALDATISSRATAAALSALQSDFNTFEVTNQSEHDATQALLQDASYGLSALNDDLDAILLRLGITTDTGGTNSSGTTMAKLNALIDAVGALGGGGGSHVDIKLRPSG